jgi:hypothetical protein
MKGWCRAGAVLCGWALLWAWSPPAEPALRFCGFYWLTGRPCPLCGLTRGLCALAKGEWTAAVGFNALTPLAAAMVVAGVWDTAIRNKLWAAGLCAFGVYGVWRVM